MNAQRTQELETMQNSNRVMLIVAGSFAVIGFVAMLLMAYFQWRTVNGLAHISTALPSPRTLGPGPALPALGPGDEHPLVSSDAAEQSNMRLLGALDQLEKRLYQLEHTPSTRTLADGAPAPGARSASTNGNGKSEAGPDASEVKEETPTTRLLEAGEELLNKDDAQGALGCFEKALALEPANADALVKKGTALERMQKLEEALRCYDMALAADGSLTIAYLHKGGLCNRLERFPEALECYERALRTQEGRAKA